MTNQTPSSQDDLKAEFVFCSSQLREILLSKYKSVRLALLKICKSEMKAAEIKHLTLPALKFHVVKNEAGYFLYRNGYILIPEGEKIRLQRHFPVGHRWFYGQVFLFDAGHRHGEAVTQKPAEPVVVDAPTFPWVFDPDRVKEQLTVSGNSEFCFKASVKVVGDKNGMVMTEDHLAEKFKDYFTHVLKAPHCLECLKPVLGSFCQENTRVVFEVGETNNGAIVTYSNRLVELDHQGIFNFIITPADSFSTYKLLGYVTFKKCEVSDDAQHANAGEAWEKGLKCTKTLPGDEGTAMKTFVDASKVPQQVEVKPDEAAPQHNKPKGYSTTEVFSISDPKKDIKGCWKASGGFNHTTIENAIYACADSISSISEIETAFWNLVVKLYHQKGKLVTLFVYDQLLEPHRENKTGAPAYDLFHKGVAYTYSLRSGFSKSTRPFSPKSECVGKIVFKKKDLEAALGMSERACCQEEKLLQLEAAAERLFARRFDFNHQKVVSHITPHIEILHNSKVCKVESGHDALHHIFHEMVPRDNKEGCGYAFWRLVVALFATTNKKVVLEVVKTSPNSFCQLRCNNVQYFYDVLIGGFSKLRDPKLVQASVTIYRVTIEKKELKEVLAPFVFE